MPAKIPPPPAPIAGQATSRASRDATPTSVTALAIIAALILVLHFAASALPAHPLAHASPAMLDDDVTCLSDAKPLVGSLPFD